MKRLLEKILRSQERQGLLIESKHGFVCGTSCLTNLIRKSTRSINVGYIVDVFYIEFNEGLTRSHMEGWGLEPGDSK